jgi:hypothetical protein
MEINNRENTRHRNIYAPQQKSEPTLNTSHQMRPGMTAAHIHFHTPAEKLKPREQIQLHEPCSQAYAAPPEFSCDTQVESLLHKKHERSPVPPLAFPGNTKNNIANISNEVPSTQETLTNFFMSILQSFMVKNTNHHAIQRRIALQTDVTHILQQKQRCHN